MSGHKVLRDVYFLVLTFSVVAIGSFLAYVKKRRSFSLVFASLHLCDLALDQRNEKDAMTQGRKDWKPQNPSESDFFFSVGSLCVLLRSRIFCPVPTCQRRLAGFKRSF